MFLVPVLLLEKNLLIFLTKNKQHYLVQLSYFEISFNILIISKIVQINLIQQPFYLKTRVLFKKIINL